MREMREIKDDEDEGLRDMGGYFCLLCLLRRQFFRIFLLLVRLRIDIAISVGHHIQSKHTSQDNHSQDSTINKVRLTPKNASANNKTVAP